MSGAGWTHVLTSHDVLGNTGRKTGFWLEEFAVGLTHVVPFLVEDELKRLGGLYEQTSIEVSREQA